jgi:hypothetical protein
MSPRRKPAPESEELPPEADEAFRRLADTLSALAHPFDEDDLAGGDDSDPAPPLPKPGKELDLPALRVKYEMGVATIRERGDQPTTGALAELWDVDDSTVRKWRRRLGKAGLIE